MSSSINVPATFKCTSLLAPKHSARIYIGFGGTEFLSLARRNDPSMGRNSKRSFYGRNSVTLHTRHTLGSARSYIAVSWAEERISMLRGANIVLTLSFCDVCAALQLNFVRFCCLMGVWYHNKAPPGENQTIFATLTVLTYVWIVPDLTLQRSVPKSTERRV